MNRFHSPTNVRHWAEIAHLRGRTMPFDPGVNPDEVEAWIRAIYVTTPRDAAITDSVRKVMARSGGTIRHALLVDGEAELGKTEALLNLAINRSGISSHGELPARVTGRRYLPTVFVETDSGQQGAGLLRGICNFMGLPVNVGESDMRDALKEQLPLHRTDLIVVDDAHMLRRISDKATKLTDSLRSALRLPATFVFVGAGLEQSALLRMGVLYTPAGKGARTPPRTGYESTNQIRARATGLTLRPLQLPEDATEIREAVARFARSVRVGLPWFSFSGLQQRGTIHELIQGTGGRHGSLMETLKNATLHAYASGAMDVSTDLLRGYLSEVDTTPYGVM